MLPDCAALLQNMLHSLHGTWRLQPVKIHRSALPSALLASSRQQQRALAAAARSQSAAQQLAALSPLAASSSSCGGADNACLPPGITTDSDGNVLATLVQYEQYAQPKGEQQQHCTMSAAAAAATQNQGLLAFLRCLQGCHQECALCRACRTPCV